MNQKPEDNQYQPVIGILTQPSDFIDTCQYISSSYVKWLQAAGAKVIPIPFDLPESQIDYLLSKLNGILYPGGNASLWEIESTFEGFAEMTLVGQKIMNKIIKFNQQGSYFPLWGTCLGLELILIALTNQPDVLDRLNSNNHVLLTELVNPKLSKIYPYFDSKDIKTIETDKVLYYNHRYGLTKNSFDCNKEINQFFSLTATAVDSKGTPFVASLEAKKYPIYVTQFHPEKNAYEWLESVNANHSQKAINAARAFADFFVNEARKNINTFTQTEIKKHNIENIPLQATYFGAVSVYNITNRSSGVFKTDKKNE